MLVCPQCGHENSETAKFCEECAAPLVEAARTREQRKTVTVLFCDVVGSTALGESTDPEALRALLARYFERMKVIVERHGGSVEKFIGDAVMAVFGVPQLHEDDALRAVRSAVEMRAAFPELGIEGRIGITTGEVVTGTEERLATGDAVNVAARLEQAARAGDVLIGEATLALVRGAVEFEAVEALALKGKSEPIQSYRILSLSGEVGRSHEATMVGRARELDRLRDAFDQAEGDRSCQLFTILGAAGVGKSRLAAEFLATVEGATVVRGRCLSYGEGITYWPVVEVVKQLQVRPADETAAAAVATLLGETDAPTTPDEVAWAIRKTFELAAFERPLVCVFDDLHWGEPAFLDLVEHVADVSRDAPILLLCLARPELLDGRPGWAGGKLNATSVLLEPLSPAETDELIERLLTDQEIEETLRVRIREAAEGNPLFVEEMLAMVREAPDGDVVVPPTIQALLAARLDQLQAPERTVLERGAVEGWIFHRSAVEALAPEEPQVTARLQSLVRKELVRPDKAQLPGDDAFRFRHLLIRDAAYEALPKSTRADLHERFAVWLEERGPDLVELDEIVGYHLEQACNYRAELDPSDERISALGQQGSRRLAAGALRALGRQDVRAAVALLERAVPLCPPGDSIHGELLVRLGEALRAAGELGSAEEPLQDGAAEARASANRRLEVRAELALLDLWSAKEPGRVGMIEALRRCEELVVEAATLGDEQTVAAGSFLLGRLLSWFGDSPRAVEAYSRAIESARRAGDISVAISSLEWSGLDAWFGPLPALAAIARCEEIKQQGQAEFGREVLSADIARGVLLAMVGRIEEGRELVAQARGLLAERGYRVEWAGTALAAAEVELIAGNPEAAEQPLREAYEALQAVDEIGYLSSVAAHLAIALVDQRQDEDALEIAAFVERIAAADDFEPQAYWRVAKATALARRGEPAQAEQLAGEAIELVKDTSWLHLQADTHAALAEALDAAGRLEEARAALDHAIACWTEKGNIVSTDRLKARREALHA